MSELRRDPVTGRWNIIATDEPAGAGAFSVESTVPNGGECPFCPGHEQLTPAEVYAVRPSGKDADGPGWSLRVVPNKFPALRIEGQLNRRGLGLFDLSNGIGAHEVLIETPDHQRQMGDLGVEELARVLGAVKTRMVDLRRDPRLRYILPFKNFGLSAGATLAHTHTQLIALPIVPKRVHEELRGAARYFDFRERCVFCDMLQQELHEGERIIGENASCLAYAPFVSNFPFEMWLVPKEHQADFGQASAEELTDFARLLRETLGRMRSVLSDPPYNFVLHSAPIELREREEYHWHLELIPKLTTVAGFEWGTGFYINPTPPELAARLLRESRF